MSDCVCSQLAGLSTIDLCSLRQDEVLLPVTYVAVFLLCLLGAIVAKSCAGNSIQLLTGCHS